MRLTTRMKKPMLKYATRAEISAPTASSAQGTGVDPMSISKPLYNDASSMTGTDNRNENRAAS